MTQLDQIALSIELTLLSVIEGFALYFLAENSIPILKDFSLWMYIPLVFSGLMFLLVFWAQTILHAVSFIRWPVRIGHMLLYFVSAFVQALAYNNIMDIRAWFFWWAMFTAVAVFLYWADLIIIRESRGKFSVTAEQTQFIAEVEKRHIYEFKTLVPAAFVFNLGIFLLLLFYPGLFSDPLYFAGVGSLQALISLFVLLDCMENFKKRSTHITSLFS